MKIIKKFLLGVFVLTLTSLIILFTISVNIKKVIVNGVIMEVVKYQISTLSYKEGNKDNNTVFEYTTDNEQINEILRSEEVQSLVTKYLDLVIEGMTDDDSLDEIDIEKDMMEYIKDNKEIIEEKIGIEITEEMIQKTEEQMKEQEINKNIKQAIKETKGTLTDSQKKTLKGYGFITSTGLKVALAILIVINCIIIYILQKAENKWIYVIGNSVFSSGIGIIVMSIIVNIIISRMASIPILKLSILYIHGTLQIIIGLLVMILYKLIKKIAEKRRGEIVNGISTYQE